eukprot:symbB.v1.2.026672.t3/scaffold2684.1/size75764/4
MVAAMRKASLMVSLVALVFGPSRLVVAEEVNADEKILEENRLRDEVIETASGLQYEVVKSGALDGPNPEAESKMKGPKKKGAKDAKQTSKEASIPAKSKGAKEGKSVKEKKQEGKEVPQGVSKSGVQKAGSPFVPADWSEKYKPALGQYKQFLKDHPEDFVLITDKNGDFIIRLPDQLDPPSIPDKKVWEKHLLKAWMEYCKAVPRQERDFRGGFLSTLPKIALATAKSPKVSPQSPILAPKSPGLSFAAEPKLEKKTKGKRKANEKDDAGPKKKLKKKATK